ncbi:MAG: ATP-binding protein, partial [Candidatus Omnitrophica bacterium]|nr:ATP-binding protein [Candidatus Omnitrophota bacterium]
MIKDKFFDRRNYIQILEKRVNGLKEGYRQNIAIIGDENVGKTSIISKFLANFYDPRIITVYLEVRPESLDGFAKRFIGALLYNFLLNSGLPLKEDLDYLISKSSRYVPKTSEKINFILAELSRRKKINIIGELFNLPELINQESGKFTVLFFDEFHNLEDLGVKNLYREWSKLLMVQKNTLYCLASSRMFKTKVILSKQLSLLFGNFELITVEPFDVITSGYYLDQHVPSLKFSPQLKNFIINFTGGYPLYLELIADALPKSTEGVIPVNFGKSQNNIGGENITDILEDLLFNTSGILNQRFSNYIKRFLDADASNDYVSIFYLIASGRNRIKDIAHILRKQKKDLVARINYLLELDAITRSGDFLKVSDRLFAYWMRFVYQEKMRSLSFDAKNQKTKIRDSIQELICEFIKQSTKPLTNRAWELLQLFEDE